MSIRRVLGGLVAVAGVAAALAPVFAPAPDDVPFLSALERKDAPGEWRSGGVMNTGGVVYDLDMSQKVVMNPAGKVVALEATLTATDRGGRAKTYRRTRHFKEDGDRVATVEETPTRTVRRSRETGEYVETVLSDTSPPLARPVVRKACYAGGGALLLVGAAVALWSGRRGAKG